MQHTAYIALGSNLGDRTANLRAALAHLRALGTITACSSLYETEPRDVAGQPWFLNAAIALSTPLDPPTLLPELLRVESLLGRVRSADTPAKGPRLLDLDLLLSNNLVLDTPGLRLPHPRLHQRLFVLVPLAEIAPHLLHPLLHRTMRELRTSHERDENAGIVRLSAPPLC